MLYKCENNPRGVYVQSVKNIQWSVCLLSRRRYCWV